MTEDIKTPINFKSQIAVLDGDFKQENYATSSTHSAFCQDAEIKEQQAPKDLKVKTFVTSATELSLPVPYVGTESPNLLPLQTNLVCDISKDNQKKITALLRSPTYPPPLVPIPFPSSGNSIHSVKKKDVSELLEHRSIDSRSNSTKSISVTSKEPTPFAQDKQLKIVLQSHNFACLAGNNDDSREFYKQEPNLNVSQDFNKSLPQVKITEFDCLNSLDKGRKSVSPKTSLAVSLKEKDLQKINENLTIGLDRLPEQRLKRVFKNNSCSSETSHNNLFNLMVVGQEGLGKSTFVNTLFQSHILKTGLDNSELYFQEGADKRVCSKFSDSLKDNPTKTTFINKTYVSLDEDNVNLKLCIIDTPGIGDYVNNTFSWVPICEFIDSQYTQFLFNEEQPFRDIRVDSRVHCCLYFILPTGSGLSALDIASMKEISKRVSLIPVIAKSDGLTANELRLLKTQIKKIIFEQHISVCDLLLKDQKDTDLMIDFPFAVIGGKYCGERNKFGREYKHGFVDVMNSTYSDFSRLSDFIIKENMIDLISSASLYYEIWREKVLSFRFKKMAELLSVVNNSSFMLKEIIPDFKKDEISKIGVTSKELSELDLQKNIDSNGLDKYKVYSVINKKFLEQQMIEWNPIFIHQQDLLKKSFDDSVVAQEKKFKDWKKTLFDKQSKFNDGIEILHNKVKNLQNQCIKVEQDVKLQQKQTS